MSSRREYGSRKDHQGARSNDQAVPGDQVHLREIFEKTLGPQSHPSTANPRENAGSDSRRDSNGLLPETVERLRRLGDVWNKQTYCERCRSSWLKLNGQSILKRSWVLESLDAAGRERLLREQRQAFFDGIPEYVRNAYRVIRFESETDYGTFCVEAVDSDFLRDLEATLRNDRAAA